MLDKVSEEQIIKSYYRFCHGSCGVCMGRLDSGVKPACAAACSARCIHFDAVRHSV
jgi:Fe-S-cluster-containing dehydrogenase component